jgi:DNA repair exonuclease SbcCD nuclease subunit
MINEAKDRDINICIFMGDFFHNRSNININTLDYGLQIMNLLNDSFDMTYFLVGNHDMYHKNKRDVTSINMASVFERIHFINQIETIDDCAFIPFMVDDEYKKLPSLRCKYVFGHLELPGYLLNKMVEMPDHGKETENSFDGCEYVFSGHFHKRQAKVTSKGTKILYTGNCFPHNFSDTWDDARGIMFLEHGGEPEFKMWHGAPRYRTFTLSELLSEPTYYLEDNVIAKVQVDIPVTMDEIGFIRETFCKMYKIREFNIIPGKRAIENNFGTEEFASNTESVDEIVIAQINENKSNVIDNELLIQLYLSL